MREDNDLISIIIPTYKRPDRLDRAINSCLNQTYSNTEIIVVDDNNDEDEYRIETEALMTQYASDNRVRYIKHKANSNGSVARNTGIQNSTGDYITFLDDDDVMYSTKLEKQAKALNNLGEEYGVVCCGVEIVEEDSGRVMKRVIPGTTAPAHYDFLRIRFGMSTGSNPMFTRKAIEETGMFDVSFIRHQDTEYMIRVLRKFKIHVIPECLVKKYVFGYPNRPNIQKYIDVQEHFFDVFKKDIDSYAEDQRNEIYRNNWHQMCVVAIEAKDIKAARNCYKKAVAYKPFSLKTKLGLVKRVISVRPGKQ